MHASEDDTSTRRGARRLLEHCAALDLDRPSRFGGAASEPRARPAQRLETLLGREFAQRLVFALSR